MADALCGPSTALQNFQKHTSVDRTLQQDRLVGRHSPSQGFRSASDPNAAAALDREFEAFQAGQPILPQPPQFQHLPPHLARSPPSQLAQAPQAPSWASDFQRLNISHAPQIPQQRAPAPSPWHQDFMSQQIPAVHAPSFQQNDFGGMSGFARPAFQPMGFGAINGGGMSEVSQGKQRAQESIPQFDEAAFERAFADVQSAEEQAHAEKIRQEEFQREEDQLERDDPALARIREQRPAVYAALKIRSAVELDTALQAAPYLDTLEAMESNHQLTADVGEAKWVVDTLKKIAEREAPQDIKQRSDRLIRAINERLMSTYPLLATTTPISQDRIWDELEAAGFTRTPVPEQVLEQQSSEQQQQDPQPSHDDDEMAQTAGRLLERVADNTSAKFQNSQFLELMRRLRDREVRVEGDKMVDVSTTARSTSPQASMPISTTTTQPHVPTPDYARLLDAGLEAAVEHMRDMYPPAGMDWCWSDPPAPASSATTTIPPIDPHILDHAATDFNPPVYAGSEHEYEHAPQEDAREDERGADEVNRAA